MKETGKCFIVICPRRRFNEVYLRGNKQQMTIHQSYVTRIDLRETVLDFPSQVGRGGKRSG